MLCLPSTNVAVMRSLNDISGGRIDFASLSDSAPTVA